MAKSNAAGVTQALVIGGSAIGALLLFPRVAKAATAAKNAAPGQKVQAAGDALLGRQPQQQPQSSPKSSQSGGSAPRSPNVPTAPQQPKSGVKYGIPTNLGKLGEIFGIPYNPYRDNTPLPTAPFVQDGILGGPLTGLVSSSQQASADTIANLGSDSYARRAVLASADIEDLPLGDFSEDTLSLNDPDVELAGVDMSQIDAVDSGTDWSWLADIFSPAPEVVYDSGDGMTEDVSTTIRYDVGDYGDYYDYVGFDDGFGYDDPYWGY